MVSFSDDISSQTFDKCFLIPTTFIFYNILLLFLILYSLDEFSWHCLLHGLRCSSSSVPFDSLLDWSRHRLSIYTDSIYFLQSSVYIACWMDQDATPPTCHVNPCWTDQDVTSPSTLTPSTSLWFFIILYLFVSIIYHPFKIDSKLWNFIETDHHNGG